MHLASNKSTSGTVVGHQFPRSSPEGRLTDRLDQARHAARAHVAVLGIPAANARGAAASGPLPAPNNARFGAAILVYCNSSESEGKETHPVTIVLC